MNLPPHKRRRLLIESIEKGLWGSFAFCFIALGVILLTLIFRSGRIQPEAISCGGTAALSFLTLFFLAGAHYFRELAWNWSEYPYWADRRSFFRGHQSISCAAVGILVWEAFYLTGGAFFLSFVLLIAGEIANWIFLPALAEKTVRSIRERDEGADSESLTVIKIDLSKKSLSPKREKGGQDEDAVKTVLFSQRSSDDSSLESGCLFEKQDDEGEDLTGPRGVFTGESSFKPTLFKGPDGTKDSSKTIPLHSWKESASSSFLEKEQKGQNWIDGGNKISDEFDEVLDEEMEESEETEEFDSHQLGMQSRVMTDEGKERIEGWFRVCFPAGDKTAVTHLSFCPPFSSVPKMEFYQISGAEVQIRVTQAETFGVRLEIKRFLEENNQESNKDTSEPMIVAGDFPDETVRISFWAEEC